MSQKKAGRSKEDPNIEMPSIEIRCAKCGGKDIKVSATTEYTVYNYRIRFTCRNCKAWGSIKRSRSIP